MNPTTEVLHAVDSLTSWISGVCADVAGLSRDVAAQLEAGPGDMCGLDEEALGGLDKLTQEFLTANTFAVGAGTFFGRASVEEAIRPLGWWFRNDSGAIDRLDFELDPDSPRHYDYEKLPFFSTAAATGAQTLWGPYVDFLGFKEYILTFTAPFSVHGQFTGVTGCDIRIKDLEPLIMPTLRRIPGDAALVNASNRIILGNSGKYLVGERIRSDFPGRQRIALDVPHLGLSLIYTP